MNNKKTFCVCVLLMALLALPLAMSAKDANEQEKKAEQLADKPDLNFSMAYESIKGEKTFRLDFGLADNWDWLHYQLAFRGDWNKYQKGSNGSAAIGVRQGIFGLYGFVDGLYQQDIGFHAQLGPTVLITRKHFSLTAFYRYPLTSRVLNNRFELEPRHWRDNAGYYIRTGLF